MSEPCIWFITGVAAGLGRDLALALLADGEIVIGTSRDGQAALEAGRGELHLLPMEPTNAGAVRDAVARAHAIHGRLDVIVNNAGAAPEPAGEAVQAFDADVLGPLRVMQAALPLLQRQHGGRMLNVEAPPMPWRAGAARYQAAQRALQSVSEGMAQALRPLGVPVTRVEQHAATRRRGARRAEPLEAVSAILAVARSAAPPQHLALGAAPRARTLPRAARGAVEGVRRAPGAGRAGCPS